MALDAERLGRLVHGARRRRPPGCYDPFEPAASNVYDIPIEVVYPGGGLQGDMDCLAESNKCSLQGLTSFSTTYRLLVIERDRGLVGCPPHAHRVRRRPATTSGPTVPFTKRAVLLYLAAIPDPDRGSLPAIH